MTRFLYTAYLKPGAHHSDPPESRTLAVNIAHIIAVEPYEYRPSEYTSLRVFMGAGSQQYLIPEPYEDVMEQIESVLAEG